MCKVFFLFILSVCHIGSLCSEQISIRAFDLGGGGLKTAFFVYDTDSQRMHWKEPQTQLGKCPDEEEVKDWIRSRMREVLQKDLDEEAARGCLFGFSLAGLEKMRSKPLSSSDMAVVCDLPKDKVFSVDDGAAHLIASLHALKDELPKGSILNFGIGTGVSVGHANSDRQIQSCDLYFEVLNIKEPKTGEPLWKVCAAKGFDQLVFEENNFITEECFLEFARRWKFYLDVNSLNQQQEMPAAIVFTGGHIEAHGRRLIDALVSLKMSVPLFIGVPGSGLLGAAWNAISCDR